MSPHKKPSFLEAYVCAQACATLAAVVVQPLDPIRRRMVYQDYQYNKEHYKGVLDCIKQIFRYKGLRVLYDATHITVLRSLSAGLVLAMFEMYKFELK